MTDLCRAVWSDVLKAAVNLPVADQRKESVLQALENGSRKATEISDNVFVGDWFDNALAAIRSNNVEAIAWIADRAVEATGRYMEQKEGESKWR